MKYLLSLLLFSLSFLLVFWKFCTTCFNHIFPFPWNTPTHCTIPYAPNFVFAFFFFEIHGFLLEHGPLIRVYTLEENLLSLSHSCGLWKTPRLGLGVSLAWSCTGLVCEQSLWVHMCNYPAVSRKLCFLVAIYCLRLLQFFWPLFFNGLLWAWEKGCDT